MGPSPADHRRTKLSPSEQETLRRGRAELERGDTKSALGHLAALSERRPRFADLHYWIALAHEREGELDAAATRLEQALRLNPGYAEARLALTCIYEQRGEWSRARSLLEAAPSPTRHGPNPSIDPTTQAKLANLQAALGEAYLEVGELREAIDAFRRALDRCPDFHDVRVRLATTLRDAGLGQQALRELVRVLEAQPSQVEAAIQLGLTLYTLGRTPDAVRVWQDLLSRYPGEAQAVMYLRMLDPESGPGADAAPTHSAATGFPAGKTIHLPPVARSEKD